MNRYKIFLLLVFITFLCGCTVEYEISIPHDLNEEIRVKEYNSLEYSQMKVFEDNYAINNGKNYTYYNYALDDINHILRYSYRYNDFGELKNSNAISSCFKSKNFSSSDIGYSFSFYDISKCFNNYSSLDSLIVRIKISDDIIIYDNNADDTLDNYMQWEFSRNSLKNNADIFFSFDTYQDFNKTGIEIVNTSELDDFLISEINKSEASSSNSQNSSNNISNNSSSATSNANNAIEYGNNVDSTSDVPNSKMGLALLCIVLFFTIVIVSAVIYSKKFKR